MLRFLFFLALSLIPLSAQAQTGVATGMTTTATSSTTARTLGARAADVVNVKDGCNGVAGAVGNDTADDTAAINACFAVVRAGTPSSNGYTIYFPYGTYRTNGSLNWTGIQGSPYFHVVGAGAIIDSHATGLPAVDMVGTNYATVEGITIKGDSTNEPTYGLQIGRTAGNANCADLNLMTVSLWGSFSQAAMWNVACETMTAWKLDIDNVDASGAGLRQDGINHFGLSSAFITVTLPTDTPISFNDDYFGGPIIQTASGADIWTANTYGHTYQNGYFSTGGVNNIILYQFGSSDGNRNLSLRVHMETVSVSDIFLLSGGAVSQNLQGLQYYDFEPEATNSIFKLDTGVLGGQAGGVDIHLGFIQGGATKVFDAPTLWGMSGRVSLLTGFTQWNLTPAQFSGCYTLGINQTCTSQPVMVVLNRNPDFAVDQVGEGSAVTLGPTGVASGSTMIDGWLGQSNNVGSNRFSTQRSTTSPPPGYGQSLIISTVNTITPSATQFNYIYSNIYVPDGEFLQFGTSSAKSLVVDFLLKANNTGTYSVALQNQNDDRSYVINCPVTAANTWTSCTSLVPGDTTGSWPTTAGSATLRLIANVGSGSNFQTTAGAWQAGNLTTTSASTNLTTISGGTLNIAAVHIYQASQALPYSPLPYSLELTRDLSYYRKTFPVGTAPAQSAGVAGALCVRNPIAAGEPSAFWSWGAPMAAAPTITTYNPSAANANWRDVTGAADVTVAVDPASAISGSNGIEIATGATVATLGHDLCIHAVADTKK